MLKAINYIADFGFNMSKIESRPSKRELGEYIIYIDLEINNQDNVKILLELKNKLKPLCKNFVDFGNYFSENWNFYTNPSWYDSIIEGIRRPFTILSLGPFAIVKSIREIPTILLMNWAFRKGLMEFGVYKCRG